MFDSYGSQGYEVSGKMAKKNDVLIHSKHLT